MLTNSLPVTFTVAHALVANLIIPSTYLELTFGLHGCACISDDFQDTPIQKMHLVKGCPERDVLTTLETSQNNNLQIDFEIKQDKQKY